MTIRLDDSTERDDLGAFTARVVRLDQAASMQLRSADGHVTAWAHTPFDVLVTRSVSGSMQPAQRAVQASSLLTSLAVDRSESVDPGPAAGPWAEELPPDSGWAIVDDIPAGELDSLAERGIALAREHAGPMGPPASLLDQTVLTVSPPSGGPGAGSSGAPVRAVKVQMRVLFAMSGMGFLGDSGGGGQESIVRVSATGSWVRLDARYGAVVRRRLTSLPLFTV